MTRKHTKIPGFVESVERGGRWWARLTLDGRDYEAEMRDPLPSHARTGSLFTMWSDNE